MTKKYLLIAVLFTSFLLKAETLTHRDMSADIKIEAFYYGGQTTQSSKIKVDRSGYQTEKFYQADKRLFDGKSNEISSIYTHFWGNQMKKITIVIDLQGHCRLSEIKVTIPKGNQDGNYADTCTLWCSGAGSNDDQWTQIVTVKNPYKSSKEAPKQYDWVLKLPDNVEGRYVKLVLYSQKSPMMGVSEVQIDGTRLEKRQVAIPKAWRFEPENVKGTVVQQFSGRLGAAIWINRNVFDIGLPVSENQKITIWVSYLDNGGRTLEVNCNGLDRVFPEQIPTMHWHWEKLGECTANRFNLKMYNIGKMPPAVDSVIFSTDPAFDPNNVSQDVLQSIPVVSTILGFADKLYKENPDIDPDEFSRRVTAHYKFDPPAAAKFVDDNGAILWNGKPFFPLAFYHANQNDPRVPAKINSFIGGTTIRKPDDPRKFSSITTFHAMWFAYDALVRKMMPIAGNLNIIMNYICDEPENVGVSVKDLQRMNSLIKALDPAHPTFVNVSAGTAGHRAYMSITDLVGVDHYPVPNGRIFDIGYSVDTARVNSGGRPVIFVAQTFDWSGYGFHKGRFPTPDEISVMCWLPIIHGCRGLWMYEFPSPKMHSKTCIKDTNPKAWERIEKIIDTIHDIQAELTGPEAVFPGKITISAPKNRPLSSRFAVSSNRSSQIFIAANAWKNPAEMTLDWNQKGVVLEPLFSNGVSIDGNKLKFSGYASGVFRVKGIAPAAIRILKPAEALALAESRLQKVIGRPEIVLPKNGSSMDLLDSWQSGNRFDQAQITAASDGVHIKIQQRFRKDAQAKITKRDGAVWQDPSIELFFGKLNSRKFCQLQINIINTQADLLVDLDSAKMFDPSVDFKWYSQVKKGLETAEYSIVILWDTLRKITGTLPGESIGFNLASTHSNADWAGLSGASYLNPRRFGIINFEDKSK